MRVSFGGRRVLDVVVGISVKWRCLHARAGVARPYLAFDLHGDAKEATG